MNVSDLMTRDVLTCRSDDRMDRAARILWERDCGCVPVVGPEGRVLGVLTDRDLAMAAFTQGRPPRDLTVGDAMGHEATCCRAEDELSDALRRMAQHQVRRLPVVDDDGRVVGLLSLADVLQAWGRDARRGRTAWVDELRAALVAVTRPRTSDPTPAPLPGARRSGRARV